MTFDECIEIVLRIEGGGKIVADPHDNGGLTKWGISLRAHPELGAAGIRGLTKARAKEIYKSDYWDALSLSKLPMKTRLAVFDTAVNHGVSGAGKLIQRAANGLGAKLALDGVIGPMSLKAIKALSPVEFLVLLLMERLSIYERHEDFASFGKGWKNRIFRIAVEST